MGEFMFNRKAVSPLIAVLIGIAITVASGLIVYQMFFGQAGSISSTLGVQVVDAIIQKVEDRVFISVTVKNTGNINIAGIVVEGKDDNGKGFALALPPAEPGQTVGNTLIIPLGQPNIVLDGSGNNNHGTLHGQWSWSSDSKLGTCLSLSGGGWVDAYIDVPEYDFTISLWIKTSQTNQGVFDIDWNDMTDILELDLTGKSITEFGGDPVGLELKL